jgi:hypothetical protein
MSEFASEFLRAIPRYLAGCGAAFIVTGACIGFGLSPFMSGWFACMAWLAVSGQWKLA